MFFVQDSWIAQSANDTLVVTSAQGRICRYRVRSGQVEYKANPACSNTLGGNGSPYPGNDGTKFSILQVAFVRVGNSALPRLLSSATHVAGSMASICEA